MDEKRYIFCFEVKVRYTEVGSSLEFVEFDPTTLRVWDKPMWGVATAAGGGAAAAAAGSGAP